MEHTPAKFLAFSYPELRWLILGFVFLVLVYLIASFRLASVSVPRSRRFVVFTVATWLCLIGAIIRAGQGFWELYVLAEAAHYGVTDFRRESFNSRVQDAFFMLDTSGGLFILGLIASFGAYVCLLFHQRNRN